MAGLDRMLDREESAKKLFGGLFRVISVGLFYAYLGPKWIDKAEHTIVSTLSDNPEAPFPNLIASLFAAVVAGWMLYWFVLGIYKVYTFNMYLYTYEVKMTQYQKENMTDVDSNFSNIDEALRYRDAKMKTMSRERAAEFYMETNRLLNLGDNKAVMGYINSKMSMMSPERRMDYLRGKK